MFECNEPIKRIQEKVISEDNNSAKKDPEEYCFISIVSHHIFTPLTAIKGYSSLLVEGTLGDISAECREKAEKLLNDSQSFITTVEKLIETSSSKKPLFYKFDLEDTENKSEEEIAKFQDMKSEFIHSSQGQLKDLANEIKESAVALQKCSVEDTNEKVSGAIQKIFESSDNLVKIIKSFNNVLGS